MIDNKFIIEAKALKSKIETGEEIQTIDIREKSSYKNPIENSEWIPASEILNNLKQIKRDIPVILYCRLGVESFCVANILHKEYKFINIFSLKAGFEGYESFK